MDKKPKKEDYFSLEIGTVSINHSWNCRIIILVCAIITSVFLVTIFVPKTLEETSTFRYFKLKEVFLDRRHLLHKMCQQKPISFNDNEESSDSSTNCYYEMKKDQFVMCLPPGVLPKPIKNALIANSLGNTYYFVCCFLFSVKTA